IQGTAADVIKLAMIELDTYIRENNCKSRMILQVHDELVFEIHKTEKEIFEAKVREVMEGIFSGKVKLTVDIHSGEDWTRAKW
ncbi:MAG: DNA polymerase I, partial [uncultured bacterium (gcode 4)]